MYINVGQSVKKQRKISMAVKVDEQTEILRYEWKLLHKKLCEKPLTAVH